VIFSYAQYCHNVKKDAHLSQKGRAMLCIRPYANYCRK